MILGFFIIKASNGLEAIVDNGTSTERKVFIMPMTKEMNDKLSEALKEVKIGDKPALDIIKEIHDKAESKDKVQKANEELIEKRDNYENEIKTLKEKITENEKSIKDKDSEIEKSWQTRHRVCGKCQSNCLKEVFCSG